MTNFSDLKNQVEERGTVLVVAETASKYISAIRALPIKNVKCIPDEELCHQYGNFVSRLGKICLLFYVYVFMCIIRFLVVLNIF